MNDARQNFRSAHFGREPLEPGLSIPRHRHQHGYIAVVLSGGYQEAGLGGRFDLRAGDVVVHGPFDTHLDHVCSVGARVLNLPLPSEVSLPAAFKIADPDRIARMAERDPLAAALSLRPVDEVARFEDWPDRLAADLAGPLECQLRCWARTNGLAPETLSRRFRLAYGVTPSAYRAELRAYRAVAMIQESDTSLAAVAAECGFADQPHLTRAVASLTGCPPGFWRRRSIPFKTDGNWSL